MPKMNHMTALRQIWGYQLGRRYFLHHVEKPAMCIFQSEKICVFQNFHFKCRGRFYISLQIRREFYNFIDSNFFFAKCSSRGKTMEIVLIIPEGTIFRSFRCNFPGLPDSSGHNKPKQGYIYQIATKLPDGHKTPNGNKIDQTAIKFTNIFHCKALQNLPKLGFLV
jgi:hypothetical protein